MTLDAPLRSPKTIVQLGIAYINASCNCRLKKRFEAFRFRMEYQHMLMDFLPPAWTVVKKLKKGTAYLGHQTSRMGRHLLVIWGFPGMGVLQNRWFVLENPFNTDDLGVAPFMEPPISIDA